MLDQAHDLRRLATQCNRTESARCDGRPPLVVVAGGKGGVGTTTVAHRPGHYPGQSRQTHAFDRRRFPRRRRRPALRHRGTIHACRRAGRPADLERGGLRRAGGRRNGRRPTRLARLPKSGGCRRAIARTTRPAGRSRRVGNHGRRQRVRWRRAARLPRGRCRGDGYHGRASVGGRHIRRHQSARGGLCPGNVQPRLHLLVNMAPTARVAEIVYYRLARTCRRLLGVDLQSAGRLATARRTSGKLERRYNWIKPSRQLGRYRCEACR